MAGVSLRNICKIYGSGQKVVDGFNLDVKDKEFIVLVGPSGCGKSTTLRMIAGLEEISSGEIYLDERLINDVPVKDRDIAMVFQSYALYPHMTVFENIAFSLKLKKMDKSEIEQKVFAVARALELDGLLKRKPRQLSGGQRQRVALGRAIVRNPKVFLLDEPLSNLDARLRLQMRTELLKLHKKLDATFIYVTHDQVEAMTMADRIVIMKDGLVQQVDTPVMMYRNPANLFVASFMGSPGINLINASVVSVTENLLVKIPYGLNKKVKIPLSMFEKPEANLKIGLDIVIGIRPESLKVNSTASGSAFSFEGTVELIEETGSEMLLHVKINELGIIIRVNHDSPMREGQTVTISAGIADVHIFCRDSGLRMSKAAAISNAD